jgi:hypothetical protein
VKKLKDKDDSSRISWQIVKEVLKPLLEGFIGPEMIKAYPMK